MDPVEPKAPIPDTAWAAYGEPAYGDTPRPVEASRPPMPPPDRVRGGLILAGATLPVALWSIVRWGAGDPAWLLYALVSLATAGTTYAGMLLIRPAWIGAIGAALMTLGGLLMLQTGLERSLGDALEGVIFAVFGLVPGLGLTALLATIFLGRVSRPEATPHSPITFVPRTTPVLDIDYDSVGIDPLEARLLALCGNDRAAFDTALTAARVRLPDRPRADQMREAISQLEQDPSPGTGLPKEQP